MDDRLWTKRRATWIRKPFKGLLQAAPSTLSQQGTCSSSLHLSSVKGVWCNRLNLRIVSIKCTLNYPYRIAWHMGATYLRFGFCFWSKRLTTVVQAGIQLEILQPWLPRSGITGVLRHDQQMLRISNKHLAFSATYPFSLAGFPLVNWHGNGGVANHNAQTSMFTDLKVRP